MKYNNTEILIRNLTTIIAIVITVITCICI